MNPWLSIWWHPRSTIRQIVDTNPRRSVLLIMMSVGVAGVLMQGARFLNRSGLPVPIFFLMLLGLGAVVGLIWLYLFGWLYRWVGSWLGGQAKNVEVRAAIAWAQVPTLAGWLLWVIVGLVSPASASWYYHYHHGSLAGPPTPVIALAIVGAIVGFWKFALQCHTLGEVHRFSSAKGFGTIAIPSALVIVPLLFAIAIPNILRGRQVANEATAIGHLGGLVNGLEKYRSEKGRYPASIAWSQMYPVNATSYGPAEFRSTTSLTNYPVQGHVYTYTATDESHYTIRAIPAQVGRPSPSSFYADASGLIRHCTPGPGGVRSGPTDRTIDEPALPCQQNMQP